MSVLFRYAQACKFLGGKYGGPPIEKNVIFRRPLCPSTERIDLCSLVPLLAMPPKRAAPNLPQAARRLTMHCQEFLTLLEQEGEEPGGTVSPKIRELINTLAHDFELRGNGRPAGRICTRQQQQQRAAYLKQKVQALQARGGSNI